MIIENAVEFILAKILSWLAPLEAVKLPFEIINTLTTLTAYGVWVIGSDVVKLFVSSVAFWFVVRGVVGLILWAYEEIFAIT